MRTHIVVPRFLFGALATLLALGLAASAATHAVASASLVHISGVSPYSDGGDPTDPLAVTACNGGLQLGLLYRNSETEPYIAVNPTDPDNLIACWHQDRWSNGAAQGVGCAYSMDGGSTWTQVVIPFTRCSGARPHSRVEFERASDPWLTFGPDGACYYMALVTDGSTPRNGMAMAKSVDGGRSWSRPKMIATFDPSRGKGNLMALGKPGPRGDFIAPHEAVTQMPNLAFQEQRLRVPMRLQAGKRPSGHGNNDDVPPVLLFHDKNSMTADPHDSRFVYATWTLFIGDTATQLVFSRSKNGGRSWSRFRSFTPSDEVDETTVVGFRQGSQLVVLPDGTLVNCYFRFLFDRNTFEFVGVDQAIVRSLDRGRTWENREIRIAMVQQTGAVDAERLFVDGVYLPVRDASTLPDIAVNEHTGDMYVVWQDGRFREFGASSVVISRSTDRGSTWSDPVPVHAVSDPAGSPGQSFLPAVAVADDGTVGVLFYDFRNDVFFDGPLDTDVYLSLLSPDLTALAENRVTPESFDMRQMAITGDRGFFPGDYVGLVAEGNDFLAAFTVANNLGLPVEFPQDNTILQVDDNNRQDIAFARVTSTVMTAGTARVDETLRPHGDSASRSGFALHPAAPSPFRSRTAIWYELATEGRVVLSVFDMRGRLVRVLEDTHRARGLHEVDWNGETERGDRAASGIYYYRLTTPGFTQTRKMILLR